MLHARICQAGCTLVLIDAGHELDRGLAEAASLLERGIDGLMPMGDLHRPDLLACVAQQALPMVRIFTLPGERACAAFDNCSAEIGAAAADHLLARMPGRPAIRATELGAGLVTHDSTKLPRR